jgi:coenzyme F420-dependent glucose-6-phosphate dehydrogenase
VLEFPMKLGYALSSEEHAPLDLVRHAARAEEVGFSFALISDHYHPWIDRQGSSPFVWSVIGAIAASTTSLRVGTGVTCPLIRTHPAIIAQAAATAASLLPGRFVFGVGTGENLNEHVLGDRWPSAGERREMLAEAVRLMRLLWKGELCSFEGRHYRVDNARIYTLPDEPIEVVVAAGGPETAGLAAAIGDGLVSTAPERALVDAYLEAGGEGPRYGQLTVCWAKSEKEACRTAHEIWPNAGLRGPLSQELPLPSHFEAAVEMVDDEDVTASVVCGPSPELHLEGIQKFVDAGFDHVYVHQIGPDQEGFFDFFEREILAPAEALRKPAQVEEKART